MSITSQDLANFNTFVVDKLTHGATDSLVALAQQWEAEQRAAAETLSELRESLADMQKGHGRLLSEFAAEMRHKYNIPPRDA